jgi:hypothetical protein
MSECRFVRYVDLCRMIEKYILNVSTGADSEYHRPFTPRDSQTHAASNFGTNPRHRTHTCNSAAGCCIHHTRVAGRHAAPAPRSRARDRNTDTHPTLSRTCGHWWALFHRVHRSALGRAGLGPILTSVRPSECGPHIASCKASRPAGMLDGCGLKGGSEITIIVRVGCVRPRWASSQMHPWRMHMLAR